MGQRWAIARLSEPVELDHVLAIEHASFTSPWTREMHLAEMENRDVAYCFLARREDGVVAGFCSAWHVVDELHVNNLAVAPAFRHQGVASALLMHLFREGERLGIVRLILEVRRSNGEARALYERFGFEASGVRRAYYTNPEEDAIVLTRASAPDRA